MRTKFEKAVIALERAVGFQPDAYGVDPKSQTFEYRALLASEAARPILLNQTDPRWGAVNAAVLALSKATR